MVSSHRPSRPWLFGGIRPLSPGQIPGEIIAGVTLATLAIPEVMGYTQIAGTPLITGLYTMLVPAGLFAIFGSSRHLVVGADSATAAILASGLIGLAAAGSDQYMGLAMALAVIVGLLLLLASVFGLGFMADFLSQPVLVGFLTGVGLQVTTHALVELVGHTGHHSSAVSAALALLGEIADADQAVMAIAGATVICLAVGKLISSRWKVRFPMAMFVVVAAIALSWSHVLPDRVPVVGHIPSGLPSLALPPVELTFALVWDLLPTAFAMAVVVLAQSAATARAYALRGHEDLNETQDLLALGLANLGAGLSGTFTVNGSPTKTAMVSSAGGTSQLSLLAMVVVVVLTLLFLTAPLSHLPTAVLSGVVLMIGIDLIDFRGLYDIYNKRRAEFWVALATIGAVFFFGVEQGIGLAVILSIISHTRHGYRPKDLVLAEDPKGNSYGVALKNAVQIRPGLIIYRFAHAMYFANAQRMRAEVSQLVNRSDPPLRWFCIDISAVDDIDYTAQKALQDLKTELAKKSISLVFAQNVSQAREESQRQIIAQFGKDSMYPSLPALFVAFGKPSAKTSSIEPGAKV